MPKEMNKRSIGSENILHHFLNSENYMHLQIRQKLISDSSCTDKNTHNFMDCFHMEETMKLVH